MHRRLPRFIRFIETPVEGGGDSNPAGEAGAPKEGPVDSPAGDGEPLGEKGLKALQEERAARAAAEKRARDTQVALEAERNAHAATRVEADGAKAENLKVQVAIDEGIPVSLAGRLVGTTREELIADAKTMKASLTPGFVPPTDPSQGKDQGDKGGGTVESGRDLYQRMRGKKTNK